MSTKIFRRLSYLLFLFLPSSVNADLLSTLVSSVFITSTFMTQETTSQACFQNRTELKSAVDDYLGRNTYASSTYGELIGSWCVDNVTDMSSLFYGADTFNQYISEWDVSKVKDMSYMFYGAKSFNKDIGGWDVSKVKRMSAMFSGAEDFNKGLNSWKVSKVNYMSYMFFDAKSFNKDISSWKVSKVKYMSAMFSGAESFNQDISSWDVSRVEYMLDMFSGADAFDQDLCAWGGKIKNSTHVGSMFSNSGCPDTDDPDLSSSYPGPFCFDCGGFTFYNTTEAADKANIIKSAFGWAISIFITLWGNLG